MIKVKKSFTYPIHGKHRITFNTIEAGEYAELPNEALESKKYARMLEKGLVEEFKAQPKKEKVNMPKEDKVKEPKPFKHNETTIEELEAIQKKAMATSKEVAKDETKKVGRPKKEV